jgi:hypothetical protein
MEPDFGVRTSAATVREESIRLLRLYGIRVYEK